MADSVKTNLTNIVKIYMTDSDERHQKEDNEKK